MLYLEKADDSEWLSTSLVLGLKQPTRDLVFTAESSWVASFCDSEMLQFSSFVGSDRSNGSLCGIVLKMLASVVVPVLSVKYIRRI